MRFFMIYPNQWATGNKPIGVATLAAVLKKAGHQFKLFDFTQYSFSDGLGDRGVGEMSLEFRPVSNAERLPQRRVVTRKEAFEDLFKDIEAFKPDMIGLSVLSDDYPLGIDALRRAREHFRIPTIVGGVHAAVDPIGVISDPVVDIVCVGEGEGTIAEIGERFDRGEPLNDVRNLWVKTSEGVIRNPVRPLIQDLDNLPYPDWSIYPEVAFYKPFDGYVYKYGDFEMSRGCPYSCSYCINVELQQVYKGKGNYHREKSVTRVIEEVSWFKTHYRIEFLKFWDETFLLMSRERLEALTNEYSEKIGIPFAIETTAQTINPKTASLLKKFGCATASLGLETGNVDLRRGILDKNTDNSHYERAFKLLSENGIRGVSFNMIGLPFEKREDIFDTIRANIELGTQAQAVGIFYPYKGTPIRTFCESMGLIDKNFEQKLLAEPTVNFVTYTKGVGSVLKLGDLTRDELIRLRNLLSWYVVSPEWMWPLIDECGQENDFSKRLGAVVFRCLQLKKYGESEIASKDSNKATLDLRLSNYRVDPAPRQAELPWLEPLFEGCERDVELGAKVLPWLHGLSTSKTSPDEGARIPEGSESGNKRQDEDFNQRGKLSNERLLEIRRQMRDFAKRDVLTRFS